MLTEAQEQEARRLYIESKLTEAEKAHADLIQQAAAVLSDAQRNFKALQDECTHPLIARKHKNDGSSGHWDRSPYYWTAHECTLCNLRWTTNQRWQHVGDRRGHPNDKEAKSND